MHYKRLLSYDIATCTTTLTSHRYLRNVKCQIEPYTQSNLEEFILDTIDIKQYDINQKQKNNAK
jgi:hypothetical protein